MKKIKIFLIVLFCPIALVLLAVGFYAVYALLAYERLPAVMELEIEAPSFLKGEKNSDLDVSLIEKGKSYRAVTYNIGFGAFIPSFSFFMDGGVSSVADSEESVKATVTGAAQLTRQLNPDFVFFQEVDIEATRSYYIDQVEIVKKSFTDFYSVFAKNYDSPFLFYPIFEPHGRVQAGLLSFSRYTISSATRKALPISTSIDKFFDLDRCYTTLSLPVEDGGTLYLVHLHLSAYSNNPKIRDGQIQQLIDDIKNEREKGSYVLCTGDFNHDMKNLQKTKNNVFSWAQIFPREALPPGFFIPQDRLSPEKRTLMADTSRNSDIPYDPQKSMTITLDSYIISDNIEVIDYQVIDHGFLYSDHQPVLLEFRLK